jgi:hypothetical protein
MGFFDDAEVNLNDVPDDPFGFGNDYWTVYVREVGEPKVTNNGNRFGMMVTWAVDDPKFQSSQVAERLGYGNWVQLPVPKSLQGSVPWDVKSEEGQKCLFQLKTIFSALGFKADEMGGVGPAEMVGRRCLAKIKVSQNEGGYWQFNVYAFKPLPENSGNGSDEFTSSGTSNPGGKDLLKSELEDI